MFKDKFPNPQFVVTRRLMKLIIYYLGNGISSGLENHFVGCSEDILLNNINSSL